MRLSKGLWGPRIRSGESRRRCCLADLRLDRRRKYKTMPATMPTAARLATTAPATTPAEVPPLRAGPLASLLSPAAGTSWLSRRLAVVVEAELMVVDAF